MRCVFLHVVTTKHGARPASSATRCGLPAHATERRGAQQAWTPACRILTAWAAVGGGGRGRGGAACEGCRGRADVDVEATVTMRALSVGPRLPVPSVLSSSPHTLTGCPRSCVVSPPVLRTRSSRAQLARLVPFFFSSSVSPVSPLVVHRGKARGTNHAHVPYPLPPARSFAFSHARHARHGTSLQVPLLSQAFFSVFPRATRSYEKPASDDTVHPGPKTRSRAPSNSIGA